VRQMLGYAPDELENANARDFYCQPQDWADLLQQLQEQGEYTYEHALRHRDGHEIWVRGTTTFKQDVAGDTILQGFVEDVTQQRLLRDQRDALGEQLRRSQLMESVGQLTSGVAHHFNNMLQGIVGNLHLAMLDADPKIVRSLKAAQESCDRAADMVRQLMVFARQDTPRAHRPVDAGQVLQSALKICRETFDRGIEIEATLGEELTVRADPGQLRQAFINLLLNARDAVSDASVNHPRIQVAAAIGVLGPDHPTSLTAGEYLQVEVRDNGTGMDPDTQCRIFEPFFTTRDIGEGTGLGLSTVFAITRQLGGSIDCQTSPGGGTLMSMLIPLLRTRPAQAAPADEAAVGVESAPCVLIIDDEEVVRRSSARILERQGHRVLSAAGGAEGLEIHDREQGRVKLVLLDLSMPGMPGPQVLTRLHAADPELPVIIFTGYAAQAQDYAGVQAVLNKPYSIDGLTRVVQRVLDGAARG
jgi:two-component system, cell cycle sensor histidine kinase and response regulator CckA